MRLVFPLNHLFENHQRGMHTGEYVPSWVQSALHSMARVYYLDPLATKPACPDALKADPITYAISAGFGPAVILAVLLLYLMGHLIYLWCCCRCKKRCKPSIKTTAADADGCCEIMGCGCKTVVGSAAVLPPFYLLYSFGVLSLGLGAVIGSIHDVLGYTQRMQFKADSCYNQTVFLSDEVRALREQSNDSYSFNSSLLSIAAEGLMYIETNLNQSLEEVDKLKTVFSFSSLADSIQPYLDLGQEKVDAYVVPYGVRVVLFLVGLGLFTVVITLMCVSKSKENPCRCTTGACGYILESVLLAFALVIFIVVCAIILLLVLESDVCMDIVGYTLPWIPDQARSHALFYLECPDGARGTLQDFALIADQRLGNATTVLDEIAQLHPTINATVHSLLVNSTHLQLSVRAMDRDLGCAAIHSAFIVSQSQVCSVIFSALADLVSILFFVVASLLIMACIRGRGCRQQSLTRYSPVPTK